MNQMPIEQWPYTILHEISAPKTLKPWIYPITIDPITDLFDEAYKNPPQSKKHFCAHLTNVYVNNGRVLNQSMRDEIANFANCGSLNTQKSNIKLNTAVHLIDKWGGTNYWHWMSTCLAKMSMIDIKNLHPETHFLVNSLNNEFVRGSLIKLGIDLSKCVEMDKHSCVFCQTLIAPGPLGDRDREGLVFLRDNFRNLSTDPKNKIFISRQGTRKVQNEKEVMSYLKKLGFIHVQCESVNFNEQVNLFSSSSHVISPHGAGLTNLLFAHDNTKVLELRSPYYFGACYWKLCNHMNLPYYSLIGEGNFPKTVKDLNRSLNSDMTICLDKLEKTLALMHLA